MNFIQRYRKSKINSQRSYRSNVGGDLAVHAMASPMYSSKRCAAQGPYALELMHQNLHTAHGNYFYPTSIAAGEVCASLFPVGPVERV